MNKEEFSDLLLQRNYNRVEQELKNGFDPNTPLEQDKGAIEWCSYSDDYKMIELLWKFGGKPTTPWTQEIIGEFENGKTFEHFTSQDEKQKEELVDFTDGFSVDRLEFLLGSIDFNNGEYSIEIPISKFILDQQETETSVRLEGVKLPDSLNQLIGKTLKFPLNPEPGYIDGSIYLRDCHNPVDVATLTFTDINENILTAQFDMNFLFQHENIGFPNERKKIKITLGNTL